MKDINLDKWYKLPFAFWLNCYKLLCYGLHEEDLKEIS